MSILVYGITNEDGSGYNRMVLRIDTKSKVEGAIVNAEYLSQETKASTGGISSCWRAGHIPSFYYPYLTLKLD